jgi:hypothetical protein
MFVQNIETSQNNSEKLLKASQKVNCVTKAIDSKGILEENKQSTLNKLSARYITYVLPMYSFENLFL